MAFQIGDVVEATITVAHITAGRRYVVLRLSKNNNPCVNNDAGVQDAYSRSWFKLAAAQTAATPTQPVNTPLWKIGDGATCIDDSQAAGKLTRGLIYYVVGISGVASPIGVDLIVVCDDGTKSGWYASRFQPTGAINPLLVPANSPPAGGSTIGPWVGELPSAPIGCDCGALKCGHPLGTPGHSSWCKSKGSK